MYINILYIKLVDYKVHIGLQFYELNIMYFEYSFII